MNADALRSELKELHRGRGVRRTDVRSWIGPQLQSILGADVSTSDDDLRIALVTLLREHTARFPRDLRYLFLVASGIVVDHPFLDDRLEVASKALDRSVRVLRRRLRTAEELLADALTQAYPTGTGPFDDQGWQWDTHRLDLVLRTDAQLTMTRTLRALADHQKYIHESFTIPGALAEGAGLSFTALAGFTVLDVDHSHPNSWGVTLELPRTLLRGQALETALLVTIPDAKALSPFLALAPVRPSRHASMRVDFGVPPAATTAWVFSGAVPAEVFSTLPTRTTVDPSLTPVVTAEFPAPRLGLAYGIGWSWAE